MTGLQNLPHDGRADKTAGTGDEDHAPPFLLPSCYTLALQDFTSG
jgi:hypothetical protein